MEDAVGLIILIVAVCTLIAIIELIKSLVEWRKEKRLEKNRRLLLTAQERVKAITSHQWHSARLFDMISEGASIEYVDVKKNNVIIKTPDGLIEAKVNTDNLPHLLLELKMSKKAPFRHTDLWINMDMDNNEVIIDTVNYENFTNMLS